MNARNSNSSASCLVLDRIGELPPAIAVGKGFRHLKWLVYFRCAVLVRCPNQKHQLMKMAAKKIVNILQTPLLPSC